MECNKLTRNYWNEMVNIKFHMFLFEYEIEKLQKKEKIINGMLAVTSSASIGAWAIFQNNSFIWSSLIAVSQVITAIRPHLFDFPKQIKTINNIVNSLTLIFIDYEYKWFEVSEGKLDENTINDFIKDCNKKMIPCNQMIINLSGNLDKHYNKADKSNKEYFKDKG